MFDDDSWSLGEYEEFYYGAGAHDPEPDWGEDLRRDSTLVPAKSVRKYRWNPFEKHWEFWKVAEDHWAVSWYDGRRNGDPPERHEFLLYTQTWAEPTDQ